MPLHSDMNEKKILEFIFKENSTMEPNAKEKNINTYFAIKFHLPSELFKSKKIQFSYNRKITYISANCEEILLFKIPNEDSKLIEIICPPDIEFISSLNISDTKKELTINNQKDKKLDYWYVKLTPDEVLGFSTKHWQDFTQLCTSFCTK